MEIYRKGQGVVARMCMSAVIGAVGIFITRALYYIVYDRFNNQTYAIATSAAGVLVFGVIAFILYNHHKLSDFMIETEGEMKKVSWPTKKELITSTIIVVLTVIILGVYIGGLDLLLGLAMRLLGKIN